MIRVAECHGVMELWLWKGRAVGVRNAQLCSWLKRSWSWCHYFMIITFMIAVIVIFIRSWRDIGHRDLWKGLAIRSIVAWWQKSESGGKSQLQKHCCHGWESERSMKGFSHMLQTWVHSLQSHRHSQEKSQINEGDGLSTWALKPRQNWKLNSEWYSLLVCSVQKSWYKY